ncbi:MAG: peroxidase [Planctomycetes bacterium]|nr:peroxidase [Planctomycetota bacterium]
MDERLATAIATDFATAALPAPWPLLLAYAARLTRTPGACGAADVATLRTAGLTDEQIVDAVQVVGFFNWINRIAEGLGVDLEPDWPAV